MRNGTTGLLIAGWLALVTASARGAETKPAAGAAAGPSNSHVDVKDVGRNIGQLGQEIKQAGHKLGEGVQEGSRSKADKPDTKAEVKADRKAARRDKAAKVEKTDNTEKTMSRPKPDPAPPGPAFSR
jgi:hypothetical protein